MKSKGLLVWTVLFGLLCSGGAAWASVPGTELPEEVRAGLSMSVREWIGEQMEASENDAGKPTKRGYWSRSYKPLDDGTFGATVHIETAGVATKTTERYLLTLKKNGKGYDIVNDEVSDTYAGLHRITSGKCYPFQSFDFNREGMELKSGPGTACVSFYQGRPDTFGVQGQNMTYRFEPPKHARAMHLNQEFHAIFPAVLKDHANQLTFDPEAFLFKCDGQSCEELIAEHFTGLTVEAPAEGSGWAAEGAGWAAPLVKDYERKLRDSPFAHFRPPYREGKRTWEVFVARDVDPFTYPGIEQGFSDRPPGLPGGGVQLEYNNWGGWELEFSVWPRQLEPGAGGGFGRSSQLVSTLYGYYSEDTLANTDPYELESRDDEYARFHQVFSVKGEVDMGLVDPEMLEADIVFGIELKQPLRELPFFIQSRPQRSATGSDKARELYVNSVQLDGEELTWTRTSQLGGLIVLPTEMPAGSKINIHMDFKTRAMIKYNHAFTQVSRFGWLPFVRFADFIDEFELTVRNPAQYTILGIGHKVSEKKEGDVLVTQWRADSPVVFPSMTFGRYERDDAGKKFDPATKADGTPIPVNVYIDQPSFQDWDIKPGSLRPIAQQAVNSINLYREISGVDYPYGELNFVNDPKGFLYGQAPSSLIYLGSGVFRGEGALAPFFDNPAGISKFLKSVTAHEVGHQWWGSRVSNANQRNYWFVESLAEYFSGLYLEARYGPGEYQEQVDEWRRTILDRKLKASVQNASSIWAGESDDGSTYQAAVYNKGPYAFHMLREIFGDEKFFPALKQFSMELAEKREIVTMDIQRALEKAFGGKDPDGNDYNVDLGWFFDQWIRGAGIPQYRLTYDVRQAEDGSWVVEGMVQQRVMIGSSRNREVLDGKFYRGVIDVTVKAKGDEDYRKRLIVNEAQTPFQFKVPNKPLEIALNDRNEILAHDVLVNKSWD